MTEASCAAPVAAEYVEDGETTRGAAGFDGSVITIPGDGETSIKVVDSVSMSRDIRRGAQFS